MKNEILELGIFNLKKALRREAGYNLDGLYRILSEYEQIGHETICIVPGRKTKVFSSNATFQTKKPKLTKRNPGRDQVAQVFNHFGNSLLKI